MKDNNNLIFGIVIAVAVFLLLGMFGFGGMMGGSYGMMGNLGFGFGGMWIFIYGSNFRGINSIYLMVS